MRSSASLLSLLLLVSASCASAAGEYNLEYGMIVGGAGHAVSGSYQMTSRVVAEGAAAAPQSSITYTVEPLHGTSGTTSAVFDWALY